MNCMFHTFQSIFVLLATVEPIVKKIYTLLIGLSLCMALQARQLYLSPTGQDFNDGLSPDHAWQSPNTAFQTLVAGDTLWVSGGTYTLGATVKSKNAGTSTSKIKVLAIRGERPVFDCSSFRNYGTESSTYRGMDLRQAWWLVRGIKIYKAGHNGIIIAGENITVEGCIVEECGHDGISIGAGSVNARIVNCDSYRNVEALSNGENGDGFAAKEGTGTIFKGCRAWENGDDGWDVYGGNQPVLVDSCWSWGNGVNYWPAYITSYQGDGNGFKLGGGGGVDGNAPNVVLHSFAFNNVGKGFDQNHNAWGVTCINCTGYNNNGLGNFAFNEVPAQGKHVMKNNLSYGGTGQNIAVGSTETTNSWNLGLTFTDNLFESLSTVDAKLPRDDDYRLTDAKLQALFRLKYGNPAIDKGTVQTYLLLKPYFAIPYSGSKPDLGGKEFDAGNWTFPLPDETQPIDTSGTVGGGTRPSGIQQLVVDAATQFTVNSGGGVSSIWGPFSLASSLSAVFDMQAVGSSSGAVILQYSKDMVVWEQVGAQAKNGSTSWVTNKAIDLSAETVPWGPAVYIRFINNSTNNVNLKNLKISATVYTAVSVQNPKMEEVLSTQYYNLQGQKVDMNHRGFLIRKVLYGNRSTQLFKQFNK